MCLKQPATSDLSVSAGSVLSVSEIKDYGEFWQTSVEAAIEFGRVSESLFQRRCRIGYNRARRITDKMHSLGWIKRGKPYGKPRMATDKLGVHREVSSTGPQGVVYSPWLETLIQRKVIYDIESKI